MILYQKLSGTIPKNDTLIVRHQIKDSTTIGKDVTTKSTTFIPGSTNSPHGIGKRLSIPPPGCSLVIPHSAKIADGLFLKVCRTSGAVGI